MKKNILIILFLGINLTVFSQNTYPEFIDNQNRAAFDFYTKYFLETENQVFSPYFYNINFSMLYLATGGGTARQVGEFAYFSTDKASHYANMQKYQKIIPENNSLNTNFKYSLNMFIEDSLKILDKYKKTIAPYLCDSVIEIDFTLDLPSISTTINSIIEKNTDNYIEGYIKPDVLPQNANILLNSSAYFSGFWANNFSNYFTAPFILDSLNRTVNNTSFLTSYEYFVYSETDDYQIVELPYEGYKFTLIVILPKKTKSIKTFEKDFSYDAYKMWHQHNLTRQKVRLILPEFSISNFYSAKSTIDTIIPAVFTKGGNFLNLIKKVVFVSDIFHYAKFEVKREDTQLSELTNYNFEQESILNSSFIFNANHPFIFLLIDKQTQAILFMGHFCGQHSD